MKNINKAIILAVLIIMILLMLGMLGYLNKISVIELPSVFQINNNTVDLAIMKGNSLLANRIEEEKGYSEVDVGLPTARANMYKYPITFKDQYGTIFEGNIMTSDSAMPANYKNIDYSIVDITEKNLQN